MSRRNSSVSCTTPLLPLITEIIHDEAEKDRSSEPLQLPLFRGQTFPTRRFNRAWFGWSFSFILFLMLLLSHSSISPKLPTINLDRLDFTKSSSHPVSIVTAFYEVQNGKKHSVYDYHNWLGNFLSSVNLPIIFYCSSEMAPTIKELRGEKPITIIDNFDSPFSMPPIRALGGASWAKAQHKIDPENGLHVPDLYGIWTAKPWLMKESARNNFFGSKYFFWVDAGSFRNSSAQHSFSALPEKVAEIYKRVPDSTIILSSTLKPFEAGLDYVKGAHRGGEMDSGDRIQGGWYGGTREALNWWYDVTEKIVILQSGLQRFAAKEQQVWTQAARLNWTRIYVQNMVSAVGDCGNDLWFSFQFFADGTCDIPSWNGPAYYDQ